MDLPITFLTQMKNILGDQSIPFLESYELPRYYGLRINHLKTHKAFLEKLPFECRPIKWCSDGYYYDEDQRPGKDPYYMAGCYYIQEPSAMTPGVAIGGKPGERIIDLCAAPGGKSTQIASDMNQSGLLVSNDISPSRVKNLHKNIQISGVRNAVVLSEDPSKLAIAWPHYFDKVLVDAPCSGEGMFRKDPKLVKSWEEQGPEAFVPIQKEILQSAHKLLAEGGELVYSTCTYNQRENEGMIQWFMDNYEGYELIEIEGLESLENGLDFTREDHQLMTYNKVKRVWPHLHQGEGHFIAKLKKIEGSQLTSKVKLMTPKISKEALEALSGFNKDIGYDMPEDLIHRLHEHLDKIYVIPEKCPETKGLRVFSSGWYLGDMKKNRFEPSQAYASGLMMSEVARKIAYDHDDFDLVKYLKGDTLEVSASKGWCLVGVEDSSIGWGKVVQNRLKNKLEPSWRWL